MFSENKMNILGDFRGRICYMTRHSPIISECAGGAEAQLYLIGKGLIERGWGCYYVINDLGQRNTEIAEGMVFHKLRECVKPSQNIRGFISSAVDVFSFNALRRSDADIIHVRGSGRHVGYAGYYAKRAGKHFVFTTAHSDDCVFSGGGLWRDRGWLDSKAYRVGLNSADCVITISKTLKEGMSRIYEGDIRVIRLGYPVLEQKQKPPQKTVLWVGRMVDWKHPEKYVKLADALPEYEFIMIGEGSNVKKHEICGGLVDGLPKNLRFIEYVPFKEIDKFFQQASVFVDTSESGGFNNTFVQAWMNSTPAVTVDFDPDEVVCDNKLGFHSKDMNQMIEDVRELMENDSLRKRLGANARKYAVKNHDIRDTVKEHEKLYAELLRK